MDVEKVSRTYKGVKKVYPIYTVEQAEEKGIGYVYWKEVKAAGRWVLTDDDYVCEVISINGPYEGHGGEQTSQLVLPFGRPWQRESGVCNYLEFAKAGYKQASVPKTWQEDQAQRTRVKRTVRLYAKLLMVKGHGQLTNADYHKLGKLYRPNEKIPAASFKRLLKSKVVKNMVAEELEKLLMENEITHDKVIKDYKEVFNKAQENKQHGVAKGVLDTFSEMLGMTGNGNKNLPSKSDDGAGLEAYFIEGEKSEAVDNSQYLDENDYEEVHDE